jgi:hypothetical protein
VESETKVITNEPIRIVFDDKMKDWAKWKLLQGIFRNSLVIISGYAFLFDIYKN